MTLPPWPPSAALRGRRKSSARTCHTCFYLLGAGAQHGAGALATSLPAARTILGGRLL